MGLNDTSSAQRVHIGFFGRRNSGKSSLVNAVTGQALSVVSDVLGTTTDPVQKSMELLPIGPVLIIDTPGMDDEGELGQLRVEKTRQILRKTDVAVVVMSAVKEPSEQEKELLALLQERKVPTILAVNKIDLAFEQDFEKWKHFAPGTAKIFVSAREKKNIEELKNMIGKLAQTAGAEKPIVSDLVQAGDIVILVTPIDAAAPKGRLILPQQQTIRDLLEAGAASIVVRETELEKTLEEIGKKPALVITDSQAFGKVSKIVPEDIKLTSFSILFARYKGDLEEEVRGVKALEHLEEGAKILIAEGCAHHRQCDDIGTVKIPRWLKQYTGKDFDIHTSSGNSFPEDLDTYDLVIHCGGCTLNRREMKNRIARVKDAGVPIVNYGIFIAATQGILKRTLEPFDEASRILNEI